jgi:GNAT superfamily N-acetyltransferase
MNRHANLEAALARHPCDIIESMVDELVPALVDPKTADRAFWSRYHAYRRLRQEETRPEDPIRPDDQVEARMKRDDPFEIVYLYEIARDGEIWSWFRGACPRPGTPEYESNKQFFSADCSVRSDLRRRGIGASWLPLIVELMDRHGCTILNADTEEESGHAFLRWLGAEEKLTGAENRLDLTRVDWAMVERWIKEGAGRSPETRLEVYDGRLPEALWSDFSRQMTPIFNTMPFDDLDHGDIVITPDNLREWYAVMDIGDERHHVVIAREPDGVMAGVTDMTWAPFRPTVIEQEFTGVDPAARGRGIGKWIKAAMLAHVRDLYPDLRWVITGNASSNAPMLAINKRLGFREYRAGSEYQIARDAVAARVRQASRG